LIKQIQDCRDIAAAANQPFSNEQILNAALHLVNQTGYYHDDVREWRANLTLTKRGPTSKLTFSRPKKNATKNPRQPTKPDTMLPLKPPWQPLLKL
jgi:hypothetical protein